MRITRLDKCSRQAWIPLMGKLCPLNKATKVTRTMCLNCNPHQHISQLSFMSADFHCSFKLRNNHFFPKCNKYGFFLSRLMWQLWIQRICLHKMVMSHDHWHCLESMLCVFKAKIVQSSTWPQGCNPWTVYFSQIRHNKLATFLCKPHTN